MRVLAIALTVLVLAASSASASVTEDLAMGKIPLYPGAKPHPVKARGRTPGATEAIATLPVGLPTVLAFYRRELPRKGWRPSVPDAVLNRDLDKVPLAMLLYERGETRLRLVIASARTGTTLWFGTQPLATGAKKESSHG